MKVKLLPLVLLGIYIFLKLQGWGYAFHAQRLEKELGELRPVLGQIIQAEQIESQGFLFQRIFDRVARLDIDGGRFLTRLSQEFPSEITLEKLQINPAELDLQGTLRPGILGPEEILYPWASRLRSDWPLVKIQSLYPDPQTPELWHFQVMGWRQSHD